MDDQAVAAGGYKENLPLARRPSFPGSDARIDAKSENWTADIGDKVAVKLEGRHEQQQPVALAFPEAKGLEPSGCTVQRHCTSAHAHKHELVACRSVHFSVAQARSVRECIQLSA